jgi:hypothetical protein
MRLGHAARILMTLTAVAGCGGGSSEGADSGHTVAPGTEAGARDAAHEHTDAVATMPRDSSLPDTAPGSETGSPPTPGTFP